MSNATQLGFGSSLITPPPAGFDPMGLYRWCESHGIENRGSSFATMYERGDFMLVAAETTGYEITVWVNRAKVDGVWVDGHRKAIASHAELNAGLMDLATR
jgi:hypothetical protein